MTVSKAIAAVRANRPTAVAVEDSQLIAWLEDLDRRVNVEVLALYGEEKENIDYTADSELIIPDTFRSVYTYWLAAMTDYRYQEIGMYNNDYVLFNEMFDAFVSWFDTKHGTSKKLKIKY